MQDEAQQIAQMSRTVRAWCISRTATVEDAEDLCQEILLAMLESATKLRNPAAFYGFLWGVAGNVYWQWVKKRTQCQIQTLVDGVIPDSSETTWEMLPELPEDIALLRRELMLLSEQYRKAVVCYYIQGMKTTEVAKVCGISQSMVKYLLFKARTILKEGMQMERNYGTQSYHPRHLEARYWGEGPNHLYGEVDSLIRQNILFACWNDRLSAEEIALAIGVGLPYMEQDLQRLTELGLLVMQGKRYQTNAILFTENFRREAAQQTEKTKNQLAMLLTQLIRQKAEAFAEIGMWPEGDNSCAIPWQMAALLLRQMLNMAAVQSGFQLKKNVQGKACLYWGVEVEENAPEQKFVFGVSNVSNAHGDVVQFMDFSVNGRMRHHDFYQNRTRSEVFLLLSKGKMASLSENEQVVAAELVQGGYARQKEQGIQVCCPVYTQTEFAQLQELFVEDAQRMTDLALEMLEQERAMLKEHVPNRLQMDAENMAYFQLFDHAVSATVAQLYAEQTLLPMMTGDCLPTTYVLLNKE